MQTVEVQNTWKNKGLQSRHEGTAVTWGKRGNLNSNIKSSLL